MKTFSLFLLVLIISLSTYGQALDTPRTYDRQTLDTLRFDFADQDHKLILRNATEEEAMVFFEDRKDQVIYKQAWVDHKVYECLWYRKKKPSYNTMRF